MYKIVGGDQREYGPVTSDQVREWISTGRANAQTLASFEGAPWKPLSTFPEFADALRTAVSFAAVESSTAKGETLLDTLCVIQAMHVDLIVIRHPSSGAAAFAARHLEAGVINGGDGRHEHPTQGLLDLLTLHRR